MSKNPFRIQKSKENGNLGLTIGTLESLKKEFDLDE